MTSKLSRLMVASLALAPALALGAVPMTISVSARVADNGRPVTGSHDFIFRFWNCDGTDTSTCAPDPNDLSSQSANVLWREKQTLTVNDGVVTAVLGTDASNPYPLNLFDGTARWFSVTMDGTDFGPFMSVNSVPFALHALVADIAGTVVVKPSLSCTTVTGTSVSIGNGGWACAWAYCASGYVVTGGGCWNANYSTSVNVIESDPQDTSFACCFVNNSGGTISPWAFARCCKLQ